MTAIPTVVKDAFTQNINVLLWRMLQLNEFDMTHDECLALSAPAAHVSILKDAAKYALVSVQETSFELQVPYTLDGISRPKISMNMRTHEGVDPPLPPRHPAWQPGHPAIEQKVTKWVAHRLYHGRMSATTKRIVHYLADLCDKGEQVRFLFPAIMLIASVHQPTRDGKVGDAVDRWRGKYAAYRGVKSTPATEPRLKPILREAAMWCTQASMLHEIGQAMPSYCNISLHDVNNYQFSLPLSENFSFPVMRD